MCFFEILIVPIVTISSVDKTPTQYTVSAMNWTYDATTRFFYNEIGILKGLYNKHVLHMFGIKHKVCCWKPFAVKAKLMN